MGERRFVVLSLFVVVLLTLFTMALPLQPTGKLFLLQTDHTKVSSTYRWRTSYAAFPTLEKFAQDVIEYLSNTDSFICSQSESTIHIEAYDAHSSLFSPIADDLSLQRLLSSAKPAQLLLKGLQCSFSTAEEENKAPIMIRGRAFDTSSGLSLTHMQRGEKTLSISEPGTAHLGTGLNTWDGSIVLAKYLERHQGPLLREKRVLEIGAGTGIAGMAAAWLGATHTLLTDLPYVIENLQSNVRRNFFEQSDKNRSVDIAVRALDWTKRETYPVHDGEQWDVIIGADIVWIESLVPALVQTLAACAKENTLLLISHQTRSSRADELLFRLLSEHFNYKIINDRNELHPDFSVPHIFVIEATKKKDLIGNL